MTKRDCELKCDNEESSLCSCIASQPITICATMNLKPHVAVGEIVSECCGEPEIQCSENKSCDNSPGCEITITQTVCIKIPIEYGATADVDDKSIECR